MNVLPSVRRGCQVSGCAYQVNSKLMELVTGGIVQQVLSGDFQQILRRLVDILDNGEDIW